MIQLLLLALVLTNSLVFGVEDAPLVHVDFYVMSKCPYAAQYVTDFYQSVLQAQGVSNIIQMTMNYIASVDPSEPTGFYSMHGQSEVWGDITELCVQSIETTNDVTWFDFVYCMDQDFEDIPNPTQNCTNQLKINYQTVNKCVNSPQGTQFMYETINKTNSLGWGNNIGSPTVYINGQCVYGFNPCQNLDPSTNAVLRYICRQYSGTKPPGCSF